MNETNKKNPIKKMKKKESSRSIGTERKGTPRCNIK